MLWARALKKRVEDEATPDPKGVERETQKTLRALLAERQASQNGAQDHCYEGDAVPAFYTPKARKESLAFKFRRLGRLRFLQRQMDSILEQHELEQIWLCLHSRCTPGVAPGEPERISYAEFVRAGEECEARLGAGRAARFFTAATFLTFEGDAGGHIPTLPLYLYIMRWASLTQTRIDMSVLDRDGDGALELEEMELYIRQLAPNLQLLEAVDPAFLPLYCRIAARKFFFFCDPQRRGKVLIREVLLSPVLAELMELGEDTSAASDPQAAAASLQSNWFTLESATRVYQTFVALDKDRSGTLSKKELSAFSNENLTDIFIERVFDEHVRHGKGERGPRRELGLGSFLELVLALENKHTPEGLAYIFKCLDLHGRGYLTAPDVYALFRSVHRRWVEGGNYELLVEDVKDEIWDMVRPADPLRITLADLLDCRQGDTVAAMLVDVGGFWAHDNRENLAAQQPLEEGEEEEEGGGGTAEPSGA